MINKLLRQRQKDYQGIQIEKRDCKITSGWKHQYNYKTGGEIDDYLWDDFKNKKSEFKHLCSVEGAMNTGSNRGSNLIKANMNKFKTDVFTRKGELKSGLNKLKDEIKLTGIYNEDDQEDLDFNEAFY